MSEIPYYFDTPIPKYFREAGWYSSTNSILFLNWAFSKCSLEKRVVVHDSKEIILEPFEFIAGRMKSSSDCLLTPAAFRNQLNAFLNAGLLKKTTNSVANRFTCYIWVTERFCKVNNQLNNQQTTNRAPTEQPQSIRENKRIKKKENHHPYPSSFHSEIPDPFASYLKSRDDEFDDLIDDDFSFSEKIEHKAAAEIETKPKIEVYPGIFLTQEELDLCIQARGSREMVEMVLTQINQWTGRKNDIQDWVSTIKNWNLKNKSKEVIQSNEEFAKQLVSEYGNDGSYWTCRIYHDKKKDMRALLFEPMQGDHHLIYLNDNDFHNKATTFIKEKKIPKNSANVA